MCTQVNGVYFDILGPESGKADPHPYKPAAGLDVHSPLPHDRLIEARHIRRHTSIGTVAGQDIELLVEDLDADAAVFG